MHRSLFRRIVGGFFAWVGFLVVLVLVIGIVAGIVLRTRGAAIEGHSILTVDLSQAFTDGPPQGPIDRALFGARPTLRETIESIDAAGKDGHVIGMIARLGGDGAYLIAQIQELRDAVAGFRANGKFAYGYADGFGELGGGTGSYYLATAFDKIWLQPYSTLGLVGLRAEQPFFHNSLDKVGIEARIDHREDFKTAMNMFTETKMTPAHREETESLLKSLFGQIVQGIAESRHMADAQVRAFIDKGPYSSEDALTAHLVDALGGRDDTIAAAKAKAGGTGNLVGLEDYLASMGPIHRSGPTIAVIDADGLIQSGEANPSPLASGGRFGVGADTLARAFREATDDPNVRAIVFRVDSPGGSAVASETIWEATLRARKAHKPLVVSMGDLAASGGYYIAANADTIVAEPGTLTGSIGVVGGKYLINGLSEKLGITWDNVQIGANASISSVTDDFTPEGKIVFEKSLDHFYAGFKSRVAQGRKFDAAKVEAVAQGRVWTGEQARSNGLVDALGGFDIALDLAKHAAGITIDSDVTLVSFPQESRTVWSRLFHHGQDAAILAVIQPYWELLSLATAPPGAFTMAPIVIK
jgi:protease IV